MNILKSSIIGVIAALILSGCTKTPPVESSVIWEEAYAPNEAALETLRARLSNVSNLVGSAKKLEKLENTPENQVRFLMASKVQETQEAYDNEPTLSDMNTVILMRDFYKNDLQIHRYGDYAAYNDLPKMLARLQDGNWENTKLSIPSELNKSEQTKLRYRLKKKTQNLEQIKYVITTNDIMYMPAKLSGDKGFFSGGVLTATRLYDMETSDLLHEALVLTENADSARLIGSGSSAAMKAQARAALRQQLNMGRSYAIMGQYFLKP